MRSDTSYGPGVCIRRMDHITDSGGSTVHRSVSMDHITTTSITDSGGYTVHRSVDAWNYLLAL